MKITHDLKTTLWCGPAAVSAVTGRPTSEIMALARYFTNRKTVKGMHPGTLKAVLTALGYTTEEIYSALQQWVAHGPNPPTLAKWTRENSATFAKLPCIILVSNHYVTVKGRTLIDTFVKEGAPLKKAPWRRARVARVFRVVKTEGPVFVPPVPPKPETTGRAAVLRLARKHRVEVDDRQGELDQIWVYPPPELSRSSFDRYDGDHCAFDWDEAMTRVKNYVEDLQSLSQKFAVTNNQVNENEP